MAVTAPADEVRRVLSAAVDPAFYRAVYSDVREAGRDPLDHYVSLGWREGRDPAPWFSSQDYLAANPDVAKSDEEPFFHYLSRGRAEGREVAPSRRARAYFRACDWAPPRWS